MSKTDKTLIYSSRPKMAINLLAPLETKEDLSLAYTPGIARVCELILKDEKTMFTHTFRRNSLAVISDGSAVLGLGNIGHKASFPVMEGKAMLFKRFAGIDAIPIVIKTQNNDEFINIVENLADSFAGINLEDINAPRCFEIEKKLLEKLSIPLMHDDQHGTAVVVLSALLNALKVLPKKEKNSKIIVNGAGAAGSGIINLLVDYGFDNIIVCDSKGIISNNRQDLNFYKKQLLAITNPDNLQGSLSDALTGADVFIGVSKGNILNHEWINKMASKPIIFAMANPIPEIDPHLAIQAGAGIVCTGRSDFPNQVNNALAFPGIFKGAIDKRSRITIKMKLAAVEAIVDYHQKKLTIDQVLPSILDEKIHAFIARKVSQAAGS